MIRHNSLTLTALTALGLALLPGVTLAQQQQHVSVNASIGNSKYTQSLVINVGDVPNHIIRAFELHRTFPNDAPIIGGLKLTETWTRGAADLTAGNGTATTYGVYLMENGDKFFIRQSIVVQAAAGKSHTTQAGFISGGTGKFSGMRGSVRGTSIFDLKANTNEGQTDIDYAIGK